MGCAEGKYKVEVGNNGCTSCGAGKYSSLQMATSSSACLLCKEGKYSSAIGAWSNNTCLACETGKYLEVKGAVSVMDCIACGAGKYSAIMAAASRTACHDCSAGTFSFAVAASSEVTCRPCAAGKFSAVVGAVTSSLCEECSAGKFSEEGSGSCQDCPKGTYSTEWAATSMDTCLSCAAGKYSETEGNSAASDCTRCITGTYLTMEGASSSTLCVECSAGKFSTVAGASSADSCLKCVAGKYAANNASTTCSDCQPGKYSSIAGASTDAVCTTCSAGKYSGAFAANSESMCVKCKAGKYSVAKGAISADTCINCDIGKFSDLVGASSSDNCSACPDDGGTCFACPAGKHLPFVGASSISECSYCNLGFTKSPEPSCTTCPAGTFASEGSPQCSMCELNADSGAGSASCECSAGFSRQQGSCIACIAGTYKAQRGNGPCDLCVSNTFSAEVGATSSLTCSSCGKGYTSAAGSTMESDCKTSESTASTASPASAKTYVRLQVILPYHREAFTREVQDNFRIAIAIASSAGCNCPIVKEDVNITSISETLRRALVARPPGPASWNLKADEGRIRVDVSIAVSDIEQGQKLVESGYLELHAINAELAKKGVSPITTISQIPRVDDVPPNEGGQSLLVYVVSAIVTIILIVMAVGLEVYRRKRSEVRVLSPELTEEVRKTVEKLLAEEERQQGRMVGGLKDFRAGTFQDAARGIQFFVGTPQTWNKAAACTTDGIIAEVKRLCDCPGCARVQARVLADMNRKQEANLTRRLAKELSDLQDARNNEAQFEHHQQKAAATRAEIEAVGGWVYGSTPGLKWKEIGAIKPTTGTELENPALAKALEDKTQFNREELRVFQLDNKLSYDVYIKVRTYKDGLQTGNSSGGGTRDDNLALPGQVNTADTIDSDSDSPDDIVASGKSKDVHPPILARMNTEDLIKMSVGEDETSGQSTEPDAAGQEESSAVTSTSSKEGEGKPPPLYRADTEDLINLDSDSPDDLVASGKSKEGFGQANSDLPKCRTAKHTMVISNGTYQKYICDQCCASKFGARWFCGVCKEDICFECKRNVEHGARGKILY